MGDILQIGDTNQQYNRCLQIFGCRCLNGCGVDVRTVPGDVLWNGKEGVVSFQRKYFRCHGKNQSIESKFCLIRRGSYLNFLFFILTEHNFAFHLDINDINDSYK